MAVLPKLYRPQPVNEKGFSYCIATPRENGHLYCYGTYPTVQRALDHSPIPTLKSYIAKYRGDSCSWKDYSRVLYYWDDEEKAWIYIKEENQKQDIFKPNTWEKIRS